MQARHQADGAGQFCGFGVWAGVLAALDPAAVGRAQGGGEADPAGELAADRLPTGAEARLGQAFAQQVHAVIGEHGQEQVGADAAGLDMENGTQARLALQAAEGGLDFGQLPVRLHDPFRTPLRVAGAQHVHAGLGVARRMLAVGLDPDRGGQLRCAPFAAAALDGNVILPRHLPVAFLEPSQPFQHLVVALRAALAGQPRVQRPDLRLEAFPPPCHDRLVLLLALLAPHPQVRLVPLAVDPPGLHRMACPRGERRVRRAVRARRPAALHRDPRIAAGAQPGQVRLCRQARVHDHRRERAGLCASSRSIAACSVPGSETLPLSTSLQRGKPAPSKASAKVASGQSLRFCLERPNCMSPPGRP